MKRRYTVSFDGQPVELTCVFESKLERLIMPKNILGFALGRVIRFRDRVEIVDLDDFTHEVIHCKQYYPRGQVRSFFYWLRHRKAMEDEAYGLQGDLAHGPVLGIDIPMTVKADFLL